MPCPLRTAPPGHRPDRPIRDGSHDARYRVFDRSPGPEAPAPGQGPGYLRSARWPDADRHVRPALGLRRRPAGSDPLQGAGPDRDLEFLVRPAPPPDTQPPVGYRLQGLHKRCRRGPGRLADQLPEAIFTPATKAPLGAHDENVSFAHIVEALGGDLATELRTKAIALYTEAAVHARARGIIIADTKFEFGLDDAGRLILIDEALTPDSSRFWPVDSYAPGVSPPSFDKQYVRDYLETLDWNKQAPGPHLPAQIIAKTSEKYRAALEKLTTP